MVRFAQAFPSLGLGAFVLVHVRVIPTLALAVGVPLNLRLARPYQRRIDALDAGEKG